VPNKEALIEKELKFKWMAECFDPITGMTNDRYLPFNEWILL
jgi:hypothetical protein